MKTESGKCLLESGLAILCYKPNKDTYPGTKQDQSYEPEGISEKKVYPLTKIKI